MYRGIEFCHVRHLLLQGVAFKLIYLNILRADDDTNNCLEGCEIG